MAQIKVFNTCGISRYLYGEMMTAIDSFLTLATNFGPCTLLYYALAVTQLIGIDNVRLKKSHRKCAS